MLLEMLKVAAETRPLATTCLGPTMTSRCPVGMLCYRPMILVDLLQDHQDEIAQAELHRGVAHVRMTVSLLFMTKGGFLLTTLNNQPQRVVKGRLQSPERARVRHQGAPEAIEAIRHRTGQEDKLYYLKLVIDAKPVTQAWTTLA